MSIHLKLIGIHVRFKVFVPYNHCEQSLVLSVDDIFLLYLILSITVVNLVNIVDAIPSNLSLFQVALKLIGSTVTISM